MGVKSILADDGCSGAEGPSARIVPLQGEAWQQAVGSQVGRGASRRVGEPHVPPGFAFGVPSGAQEARRDTVGSLLRGNCRPEDLLPDRDLGQCVKEGRRNITTETRAFGKPTRPPEPRPPPRPAFGFAPRPRAASARSDGGSVASLIAPDRFVSKGTSADEFSKPRGREEVNAVLADAGYRLEDRQFDKIWNSAVRRCGADDAKTSLGAVVQAFSEQQAAAA